jgi:2-amino-4-hydroxy-6-hydroxymethyldihydropteridine diphosphokinase
MHDAWIGVGSNVGDRVAFCRRAVEELASAEGVEVAEVSSIYETTPVGGPPQRSFMNLVVRAVTELDPRRLLETCKAIEAKLGREDEELRWGPRVADLDLLSVGDEKVSEPDLEVPHPRLTRRRFVLVPLLEIDPDASDPWGYPYSDKLEEAEGEVRLHEAF